MIAHGKGANRRTKTTADVQLVVCAEMTGQKLCRSVSQHIVAPLLILFFFSSFSCILHFSISALASWVLVLYLSTGEDHFESGTLPFSKKSETLKNASVNRMRKKDYSRISNRNPMLTTKRGRKTKTTQANKSSNRDHSFKSQDRNFRENVLKTFPYSSCGNTLADNKCG